MARRKYRIELDDRTDSMPEKVLLCRAMGHPWTVIPMSPSRRAELLRLGQTEFQWLCIRCDSIRIDLCELPSLETLARRIEYSDDYLLKEKGTGRLRRVEAKKAFFVRYTTVLAA